MSIRSLLQNQWVRIPLAVILVLLGIVGLFLPVLQGVLFILAGLMLLGNDVPALRACLYSIYRKAPRIRKPLRKWLLLIRRSA
ncbi:MAG: hypothetical protein H6757_06230 [Candidatus Omnitrophica bacterium]|nr:hypothetical protein [Candidatus Omnitrophota bacterium]